MLGHTVLTFLRNLCVPMWIVYIYMHVCIYKYFLHIHQARGAFRPVASIGVASTMPEIDIVHVVVLTLYPVSLYASIRVCLPLFRVSISYT